MEGTKVKKGINILEEILRENKGKDAMISISHKLYGPQKIKCKLDYIFDDERIGFRVNGQEIFIYKPDIIDYGVKDGIYFADKMMETKIKLNMAVK